VLEKEGFVLSVVVVAGDEVEGEAELGSLGSAHVDHAFFVSEVGEEVVENVVSEIEASAF
jgi:hypothetical protein